MFSNFQSGSQTFFFSLIEPFQAQISIQLHMFLEGRVELKVKGSKLK